MASDSQQTEIDATWRAIIEPIHNSGRRAVIAITGGGSGAIAELLRVPGGSRTLLEAIVPYDLGSLAEFLGHQPDSACSTDTAIAMARRARRRAAQLCHDDVLLVGVGATASLVSNRPKKGKHRCHIAADCGDSVRSISVELEVGRRDRGDEEELVAREIIRLLAETCQVPEPADFSLLGDNDEFIRSVVPATDLISQLLNGRTDRVTMLPDGQIVTGAPVPLAVLAGSFNPLHAGHLGLSRVAAEVLQSPISCEISVLNVDKPPLAAESIRRRLRQFQWRASVELTRAPTFLEKSRLLPGATFVVGADTAERIVHPKYYGGESNMAEALAEITSLGCRFLVAGRSDAGGRFQTLADVSVPPQFAASFDPLPEAWFRFDLSSTELRACETRQQTLQ